MSETFAELCVNINKLRRYRISPDFKFNRSFELQGGGTSLQGAFPWKASTNEEDSLTLSILAMNDTNIRLYQAFIMHAPDEPPIFLQQNEFIEFDGSKSIEVFITPNVITTDKDLTSFKIEDRACFMEDEKYLRFFKTYTVKNCMVECFANHSAEVCGCVPFDVVRDAEMPVCELFDYLCVNDLKYELKFLVDSEKMKSCNCLQLCNSITYEFEYIETRFADL
jgi:Amiloride-sensitive sodium channel